MPALEIGNWCQEVHYSALPFSEGKFIAATRDSALDLMASKLNCDRTSFRDRYMESYQRVYRVLGEKLPELGCGKDGFRPPF